ncbi:nitroreductase family protein [bacterium]|nr:nitroreductase family protein [bacterium]
MRRILRAIRNVLSPKWQHRLHRHILVPAGYREMISRANRVAIVKVQGDFAGDQEVVLYDLRRVAHILEKGLLHPNWEPGHGGSIYRQLCAELINAENLGCAGTEDQTYEWACSLKRGYEQAQQQNAFERSKPREQAVPLSATEVEQFIRTRRSVRSFEERAVPAAIVKKIVDSINWSSTSCNRQPAVVYVAQTVKTARECMRQFKGATGISSYVPCFIVFCADMRGYTFPAERLLPAIDVALGMQNVALMAHGYGLSLTMLSWAQHSPRENTRLRALFDIPMYHEIIAGCLCGYPGIAVAPPARKSVEATMRTLADEGTGN